MEIVKKVPPELSNIRFDKASSEIFSNAPGACVIPALFTIMSGMPKCDNEKSFSLDTEALFETSTKNA